MSNLFSTYDNQWTLTFDAQTYSACNISAESGVFLGNGKVGLLTSFSNVDVAQTMITNQLRYYNGSYRPNITEPFYVNSVKFFDNRPDSVIVATNTQSLNMSNAIFTSSKTLTEVASSNSINLEYDLYTPHQLPFCVMQTFRITPSNDMAEFLFYHEVYAKDNISDAEYNNNVIYNESINASKGLYILSGKGKVRGTSDQVVSASCYLIEMPDGDYENMGFNVYRTDLNRCYNKFKLKNLVAGVTVKVHVISALMTSFDFEMPVDEVKRIVLNVANKGASAADVALKVRTDHINAWLKLWATDVTIAPKVGISTAEADDLNKLKRYVRYSLYNIYSSIRENINVEINPMNLSVIDYDGSVLYDGDLWLIPLLTLLKPDVARALLEYRYKMIDTARQLAAGYGYKGTKFPYIQDSIGYKNSLYWDTVGPLSVFNTALISINVWNYFRATRDRDWLRNKGYMILKENADFFASKIERDSDGTWHLRNVVGIAGEESPDQNAFTNNMVKLALKYAVEASYELQYGPKETWLESYYGLPFMYYTYPNYDVMLFDVSASGTDTYNILEPLFVLLPYYSQVFFMPELGHTSSTTSRNLAFYENKAKPETQTHPFNTALLSTLYANYAHTDPAAVVNFKTLLCDFLDNNVSGVWGHMTKTRGGKNDIIINALLVFILVQGVMKLNLIGGVAETRFYYEELRLDALTSANMPNTWRNIKVTNAGADSMTFTTTNSLYYVAGSGGVC